jgi:hypothetical protein
MSSTSSPSYARSRPLLADRKPTSTAELRIDLAYLSSDLKYSNALPLRLRAACVPHALHPTDEFDAPSVRKDTQPENTRVQPSQGPLRSTSRISSLLTSMRVCTLGLAQKAGRSKSGSSARVLKSLFHKAYKTQRSDKI